MPTSPAAAATASSTQFDLDSVGVVSEVADTEIVAAMCDTLSALEVGRYKVRYSSRGILNVLLAFADVEPERGVDVFRVLDKLDKIGPAKVRLELTSGYQDESGDTIPGLGLSGGQVDRIEEFLKIRAEDRREVVQRLRDLLGGVAGGEEQIGVVERISDHLYALGYGDDRVDLDLSIARGLAYYTGPVFEAQICSTPRSSARSSAAGVTTTWCCASWAKRVPATGASIGVDRLLAALLQLGKVGSARRPPACWSRSSILAAASVPLDPAPQPRRAESDRTLPGPRRRG